MQKEIKQIRFLRDIDSIFNLANFKKGDIIDLPFVKENKKKKEKSVIENELREFSDKSNFYLSFSENRNKDGYAGRGWPLKLNEDFEILAEDVFILK